MGTKEESIGNIRFKDGAFIFGRMAKPFKCPWKIKGNGEKKVMISVRSSGRLIKDQMLSFCGATAASEEHIFSQTLFLPCRSEQTVTEG